MPESLKIIARKNAVNVVLNNTNTHNTSVKSEGCTYLIRKAEDHLSEEVREGSKHIMGMTLDILAQKER